MDSTLPIHELIGDEHFSSSLESLLKAEAFDRSDEEKIFQSCLSEVIC